MRAVRPDVTVIHAQQADRHGNVMLWGLAGVQKEAVLAATARRSPRSRRSSTSSSPAPTRWCCRPGRSPRSATCPAAPHPSYAAGYSTRDNDFYSAWDEIARDRDRFTEWMREHVTESEGVPA